ncbi:MAG: helix-turn-helix domain-containing protein [Flavobacteriaceae bacterium]
MTYAKTNLIYAKTHKMTIGIKIKRLRESHRISQSALASMLDTEQSHLSRIESGKTNKFTVQFLYKLCKVFHVNFMYFIDEEDAQANENLAQLFQNFDINPTDSVKNQELLEDIKAAQNTLKKLIKSFKNKR